MRSPRILTVTLGTASLLAVSGVAFAVVQSVDSSPAPQVVTPTSTVHSATPKPSDDRGGSTSTTDDNPATHDVGDDKGGATSTGTSNDNPATHDVGDDKSGTTSGRSSGSGGGSGSGRGGADDSRSGGHGSDG